MPLPGAEPFLIFGESGTLSGSAGCNLYSASYRINGSTITVEPVDGTTPEIAFEKQWVVTLLEHVFASVRAEYEEKGKADLFDALKFVVSAGAAGRPYAEIAEDLGCSEGTVKVCVHRLRGRYQERLREAVADTLLPEESVDEEIRSLMAVFD